MTPVEIHKAYNILKVLRSPALVKSVGLCFTRVPQVHLSSELFFSEYLLTSCRTVLETLPTSDTSKEDLQCPKSCPVYHSFNYAPWF